MVLVIQILTIYWQSLPPILPTVHIHIQQEEPLSKEGDVNDDFSFVVRHLGVLDWAVVQYPVQRNEYVLADPNTCPRRRDARKQS